ncbi:hypothetical protein OOZ15_11400 [Galbibacter sp. EGI 63066]|uniref:hypothetical protein n=1 Tax=Galbibacter sp. EGI 63066 TaxID=2993559 RepID=UPI002248A194|nr:hypothetical protein [Galbibacter sp. EGI 63066]MCX2680548.1 hypothetical protein [Galbibacter sp. EGI 63066]
MNQNYPTLLFILLFTCSVFAAPNGNGSNSPGKDSLSSAHLPVGKENRTPPPFGGNEGGWKTSTDSISSPLGGGQEGAFSSPPRAEGRKRDSSLQKQLHYLQQRANYSGGILGTAPRKEAETKVFKSFPELDATLIENEGFHKSFQDMSPEFDKEFLEANFPNNPKVDTLINQAKKAFDKVQELQNFVDIITGNELLELPVGLSKKTDSTSGNRVELVISEVKFLPEYAEFKAWARLTIPQKEKQLYFGAEGIKLSHDGALIGDMRLVLLGDVPIPINGDNWLLTLKGGIDLKTGAYGEQSYVDFDCSGLKEISLEGDLRVSRKVLLPIDSEGNYVCGDGTDNEGLDAKCYVGTSFSIKAEGWNDLLMEVSLPDFEVTGFKGWGFHVDTAVLDLSDFKNSSNLTFPKDYNDVFSASDPNLWRGFYAKEVSVMLPEGIKRKESGQGRVTFGAQNLIIDSYGVSGYFYGKNILPIEKGAADKWAFGIDSVSVNLSMNALRGGSLKGGIQVPTFEEPMGYHGWIAPQEYGLAVTLAEDKDWDVPAFSGTMTLKENSSVGIKVKEKHVYPFANLTGGLTIGADIGQEAAPADDGKKKMIEFVGIEFQELELQTEPGKPIIKVRRFKFDHEFNLMNFPVSIDNLNLVTPADNQAGLAFDLTVNFASDISATTSLAVLGELEPGAGVHKWKFEKVKLEGAAIDVDKAGMTLKGGLKVMEDDPTYGDGFAGELTLSIDALSMTANAKAMFGATDFRYWFVDVWTDSNKGGGGKFLIKSFLGGLSNRMRREIGAGGNFTPSEAVYYPDENYGLGLRAGVEIGTPNGSTFSGKAFLEMQFNNHGGLNRIGFTGEGSFMSGASGGGSDSGGEGGPAGFGGLEKTLKKVNDFYEDNKERVEKLMGSGNFMNVSQEAIPLAEVAQSGMIGVYVGIEKDFTTDTFHGEFELYLDLKGIRGAGPSNRAGYAVIHDSPEEWYLYVGTPVNRLGLVFSIPPVEIEVGGYFMTGDRLPDQIPPHPRVMQILGDDILNNNRKDNQLAAGRGFAFGLNFVYRYNFEFAIFYAFVEAGAGFDVMHAYYPDTKCRGRSGAVGNNGWYSMGQVYAYLYGEFGVKVDLFFIKGKFPILQAGIAALLRGQFPNPVYIEGYVGMYYSILGGLVKGRYRMHVEFGEECIMENMAESVGVPIISDVSPKNNAAKVDVFTAPQAVFNYAVNQNFTVESEDGPKTFRIKVKEFKVSSGGKALEGKLEYNTSNDAVTFVSEDVLPSEKRVDVLVEVSFDEYKNGSYTTLTDNGKLVTEKREVSFTTDKAPDYIPLENIAYMYPIKDQQNFYPEEYNKGYVKLKRGQPYLFDGSYTIKAEMAAQTGMIRRTTLSYDNSKKMVHFDLPEMLTNTNYQMNVMAFPPGQNVETEIVVEETEMNFDQEGGDTNWYNPDTEGTENVETQGATATVSNKKAANVKLATGKPKSLLDYNFHTSKHETFGRKIRAINSTSYVTNYIYANVHSLSIVVDNYEIFEEAELKGVKYSGGQALVYGQATIGESYYRNKIKPLIYEEYPLDGNITVNRDEQVLGLPPVRAFYLSNNYMANYLNNPNSYWVKNRIPFVYNLPYQFNEDFVYLRDRIVNRYVSGSTVNQAMFDKYDYIINGTFPPLPLGKFEAKLIYRTPGGLYKKGYDIDYKND